MKLSPINILLLCIVLIEGCTRNIEEKNLQASFLLKQADSLISIRKYTEAKNFMLNSIPILREGQNDSLLCEGYILLGVAQNKVGDHDSSILSLREALDISKRCKNMRLEARAKLALAQISYDLGLYNDALTFASDAVTLSRFLGILTCLWPAYSLIQKANYALCKFEDVVKISDEMFRADSLYFENRNLGGIYPTLFNATAGLENLEGIRNVFSRWLKDAEIQGNARLSADAYFHFGKWFYTKQEYDSAMRSFSKALELCSISQDSVLECKILYYLGNLSFALKKYIQARQFYLDYLTCREGKKNTAASLLVQLQVLICELYLNPSLLKEGGSEFVKKVDEIVSKCQQIQFRLGSAFALFIKGVIYDKIQDYEKAKQFYHQALKLYESSFVRENQFYYLSHIQLFMDVEGTNWFDGLIRINLQTGDISAALSYIERKNMIEFINYFSPLTFSTKDRNIDTYLYNFQYLRNSLRLLDEQVVEEITRGTECDYNYLGELNARYHALLEDYKNKSKELHSVVSPFSFLLVQKEVTIEEVQKFIPTGSIVLEYAPTTDALYILFIKQNQSGIKKVITPQKYLLKLIEEYNSLVSNVWIGDDGITLLSNVNINRIQELSPLLYKLLIDPIELELKEVQRIYFVPPKEFGLLPFHTFRKYHLGSMKYLIELYEVNYLPSIVAFEFSGTQQEIVTEIAGLGYPGNTQWDVEYELKDIRAFYDKARMYFNRNATFEQVNQLPVDVLHISAEFVFQPNFPLQTGVLLSDGVTPSVNKLITLGEFFKLQSVSTIIFSNISPRKGGLNRYVPFIFLVNGSNNVILTLWQGDRRVKKYFGEIFYTRLKEGKSTTTAYVEAMRAMIKSGEYAQPYRWGLFFQFGK